MRSVAFRDILLETSTALCSYFSALSVNAAIISLDQIVACPSPKSWLKK